MSDYFQRDTVICQYALRYQNLYRLVSGQPGSQDFGAYWRTVWSTVFIPADQCLDSKVQFSPLSRDFPSWGRHRHI